MFLSFKHAAHSECISSIQHNTSFLESPYFDIYKANDLKRALYSKGVFFTF